MCKCKCKNTTSSWQPALICNHIHLYLTNYTRPKYPKMSGIDCKNDPDSGKIYDTTVEGIYCPTYSSFFGVMGATSAMAFSGMPKWTIWWFHEQAKYFALVHSFFHFCSWHHLLVCHDMFQTPPPFLLIFNWHISHHHYLRYFHSAVSKSVRLSPALQNDYKVLSYLGYTSILFAVAHTIQIINRWLSNNPIEDFYDNMHVCTCYIHGYH